MAAAVLKPDLVQLKSKMDYSEYGGAGLFGLNAPVIKAHGSSDSNALYSAVRQTREMVQNNVAETIKAAAEKLPVTGRE
ncbi:Phosphate acyltransferase [Mycobacteroides abscessus subsp. abscessus]|nr:Phosphate acyltransferase [Mycobacteroides abscessus subsp. abscessus]